MIKMSRKEKKELALSELLLIIAAAIGILVVIWLAWIRPMQKPKPMIDSYETCAAAGYPIQDSYPEVCVTPEGQRYVNPDQRAPGQPDAYLTIKEWGIKVPLQDSISDAYATYSKADDSVYVTTSTLDAEVKKISGCTSGMHGVTYTRAKPGDRKYQDNDFWTKADLESQGLQPVQGFYIFEKPMVDTLCVTQTANPHVQTVIDLKQAIQKAFASPVAE